jgi:hypothetical protein
VNAYHRDFGETALMFGWFSSPKKQPPNAKAILESSIDAVSKLGELMETYPGFMLDASVLPRSKDEMKAAIKLLWAAFPQQRDVLEVGYLSLANFQAGIGNKPVPLTLPQTLDPTRIISSIDNTMSWMNRQVLEMEELHRELIAFKKTAEQR